MTSCHPTEEAAVTTLLSVMFSLLRAGLKLTSALSDEIIKDAREDLAKVVKSSISETVKGSHKSSRFNLAAMGGRKDGSKTPESSQSSESSSKFVSVVKAAQTANAAKNNRKLSLVPDDEEEGCHLSPPPIELTLPEHMQRKMKRKVKYADESQEDGSDGEEGIGSDDDIKDDDDDTDDVPHMSYDEDDDTDDVPHMSFTCPDDDDNDTDVPHMSYDDDNDDTDVPHMSYDDDDDTDNVPRMSLTCHLYEEEHDEEHELTLEYPTDVASDDDVRVSIAAPEMTDDEPHQMNTIGTLGGGTNESHNFDALGLSAAHADDKLSIQIENPRSPSNDGSQ